MKRTALLIITGLMVFMMAAGCSLFDNINTPDKEYLVAREQLNSTLEQYISIQDEVSDVARSKLKIAFIAADTALDAWGRHLETGGAYQDDIKLWVDARKLIIEILKEVE